MKEIFLFSKVFGSYSSRLVIVSFIPCFPLTANHVASHRLLNNMDATLVTLAAYVCTRVCMCMRACAFVYMCAQACVHACAHVCACMQQNIFYQRPFPRGAVSDKDKKQSTGRVSLPTKTGLWHCPHALAPSPAMGPQKQVWVACASLFSPPS